MTNNKVFTDDQWPVECSSQGPLTTCKYFSNSTYQFSLPCECQYSGVTRGYCPVPNKKFMRDSASFMSQTLNFTSHCHTLDRFNLVAQKDCGAPVYAPEDYQIRNIFAKALDTQFQTWYWSFTRDPDGLKCLNQVFP